MAKGLKVPCLFMITEVSIRCQKNGRLVYAVYPRIPPPNTPLITGNCFCHHRIIIQHIPLGHHSMGKEILSNILVAPTFNHGRLTGSGERKSSRSRCGALVGVWRTSSSIIRSDSAYIKINFALSAGHGTTEVISLWGVDSSRLCF